MRAALRLLASVQKGAHHLEAGAPTGLTGLPTHASPRTALIYLYSSTLEKLKEFPEHSVYRQSTEALIRHRIGIVESVKPAGLAEWQKRVQPQVDAHPAAFRRVQLSSQLESTKRDLEAEHNIAWKEAAQKTIRFGADDPEYNHDEWKARPQQEGPQDEEDVMDRGIELARDDIGAALKAPSIEPEPPLTADQVSDIENQIGAGLIEEVIQVAEGEMKLAETMLENKVWEDLEEKPVEGQWKYFERSTSPA